MISFLFFHLKARLQSFQSDIRSPEVVEKSRKALMGARGECEVGPTVCSQDGEKKRKMEMLLSYKQINCTSFEAKRKAMSNKLDGKKND